MSFLPGQSIFTAPGTNEARYTNSFEGWLIDPSENMNGINVTTLSVLSTHVPEVWITTSETPADSERIFPGGSPGTHSAGMAIQNIFLPNGFGVRVSKSGAVVRYNVL